MLCFGCPLREYAIRNTQYRIPNTQDPIKATKPKKNGCACGKTAPTDLNQADLRHPETSTYSCFLSDLTRFAASCRSGPNRSCWSSLPTYSTISLCCESSIKSESVKIFFCKKVVWPSQKVRVTTLEKGQFVIEL